MLWIITFLIAAHIREEFTVLLSLLWNFIFKTSNGLIRVCWSNHKFNNVFWVQHQAISPSGTMPNFEWGKSEQGPIFTSCLPSWKCVWDPMWPICLGLSAGEICWQFQDRDLSWVSAMPNNVQHCWHYALKNIMHNMWRKTCVWVRCLPMTQCLSPWFSLHHSPELISHVMELFIVWMSALVPVQN